MKKAVLLIVAVVLAFWACATVPDDAAEPVSMLTAKGETVPVEAADPAVTKAIEKTPVPESPAPVFRLDTVASYLANGVLDTITRMVYEDGLLVEERSNFADGSPADRVAYTYENGFLVRSAKTDRSGTTLSAHGYVHDKAGNLLEETLLDAAGNPIFSYRYAYDSDNRRTELKIVSSDGQTLGYATYTYADGRNHRVETFSMLGEMEEYLVRTFDDAGRPALELLSDASGTELEKVKFEYLGGSFLERETYVLTRKTGSVAYQYDEGGKLIIRIRKDRAGKVVETNDYAYIEVKI